MNRKVAMLKTCVAAGLSVLLVRAAEAGSCILAGSLDRLCASSAYAVSDGDQFELRSCVWDWNGEDDLVWFDSSIFWYGFGDPLMKFQSFSPHGFTISIR